MSAMRQARRSPSRSRQAAPADIFFSADLDWMDYLQERNLIAPDSRVTLLGNEIVLVAPADSDTALEIAPGFALAEALRAASSRWLQPPPSRPANTARRRWKSSASGRASPRMSRRRRTCARRLALVARGEAPLGIVYTTDAKAEPGVKVVGTFPANSHPPILYPVALTASARPEAREFLDYLTSAKAKPFFETEGFRFIAPGS